MVRKGRIAAGVICLFISLVPAAHARNYVQALVRNLLEIGYPISHEDVVALDKIAMRFDSRNRLDVLKKILSDREGIHGIQSAGYYKKTEVICNALRLLDEHNLPETDALIKALSRQEGWEKREKERLSYMAAKRDFGYDSNTTYLLAALTQYRGSSDLFSNVEISVEILDFCNVLLYLSDIFSHTGDVHILNELIHYASRAYGYPGEYVSRLLVNMFLDQPKVFVSILAEKHEKTRNAIIDSVVFGIWNNQQKGNVMEAIRKSLNPANDQEKDTITLLMKKIGQRFENPPTKSEDFPIDRHPKK